MAFHAQLVIRSLGDRFDEDAVGSIVSRCGASIEDVARRINATGGKECDVRIAFARYHSLDEIVRAVGAMPGVAIRGVTLFSSRTDADEPTEAR